MKIFEQY